jgi:hypothetical protein
MRRGEDWLKKVKLNKYKLNTRKKARKTDYIVKYKLIIWEFYLAVFNFKIFEIFFNLRFEKDPFDGLMFNSALMANTRKMILFPC